MENLTQQFEAALASSPLAAFILVYLAGILTSLTPCVLPLFPVAVGTITASARKREFIDGKLVETVTSKSRALAMGVVYALGLASMFAILGVSAALSGKAVFGMLASSPIAYLAMAAIMLLLVLWMWKGDRIDPGASLQNWAFAGGENPGPLRKAIRWYGTTQGGGAAGTFAFGFISGILAGPCTAPVIALVLTYVAKMGAVTYGVALMFVYAMGLATLMVIAGMSATLATRIRKGGNVARYIKGGFVVVMALAAAYFLYQAAYFAGWMSDAQAVKAPIYKIVSVSKQGAEPTKAIQQGAILPDFRYRLMAQKGAIADPMETASLGGLRGKVVAFSFWGIWCAECVREIPDLKKLAAEIEGREDVVLLSVNVLDDPARVPGFVGEKKITYPVIIDGEGKLIERLGAVSFPLNMIVDPKGKIVYSASAFPKNYAKIIDAAISAGKRK